MVNEADLLEMLTFMSQQVICLVAQQIGNFFDAIARRD